MSEGVPREASSAAMRGDCRRCFQVQIQIQSSPVMSHPRLSFRPHGIESGSEDQRI